MSTGKYRLIAEQSENEPLEERTGTRIRAFLAMVRPLAGTEIGDHEMFWEGRAHIEELALAFDTRGDIHWDASDCATVLNFLHWIQPINGKCYCNDRPGVSATCGFHAILIFMQEELETMAVTRPKRARRKASAEVDHE